MYRQEYGAGPSGRAYGQGLRPYLKDERLWVCPAFEAPPGMQVAISYAYLLDGDRLRDSDRPVGARSVIIYCDEHRRFVDRSRAEERAGLHRFEGIFPVLRQDGAAERIPAERVQVRERPSAREPASAQVMLEFPD
jgi:hypothetical protein